jgi:hypothetical protein
VRSEQAQGDTLWFGVWFWLTICTALLVYVTYLLVRSLRRKEPIGKALRRWFVRIIDIFSGGG